MEPKTGRVAERQAGAHSTRLDWLLPLRPRCQGTFPLQPVFHKPVLIVACWEGQSPRLQAKASAFLTTRQGGIEGARPYYLGACSIRLSLVQQVLVV